MQISDVSLGCYFNFCRLSVVLTNSLEIELSVSRLNKCLQLSYLKLNCPLVYFRSFKIKLKKWIKYLRLFTCLFCTFTYFVNSGRIFSRCRKGASEIVRDGPHPLVQCFHCIVILCQAWQMWQFCKIFQLLFRSMDRIIYTKRMHNCVVDAVFSKIHNITRTNIKQNARKLN